MYNNMGLTVNESLTTVFGFELSSYYMSLTGFRIDHKQVRSEDEKKYAVQTSFLMWASKEAKDAHKPNLGEKVIKLELEEAPNGNVYQMLYDEVKKTLTDYVDDL
jgi:hypothetical protein